MSDFQTQFDAMNGGATPDPFGAAEPRAKLPAGTYNVRVDSGELVKTDVGLKAKFKFKVVGGKYHDKMGYADMLITLGAAVPEDKIEGWRKARDIGLSNFAELAINCGVAHKDWVPKSEALRKAVDAGTVRVLEGTFTPTFSELVGKTVQATWAQKGEFTNIKSFGKAVANVETAAPF